MLEESVDRWQIAVPFSSGAIAFSYHVIAMSASLTLVRSRC